MTSTKYIGMDVHTESISIAVRNSVGKVVSRYLASWAAYSLEFSSQPLAHTSTG
jgi:hypothetical protein